MVHSGFIAQEVGQVWPPAMVSAGANYKGVDPNAMLSVLVMEVQEQRRRVNELQELKAETQQLKARNKEFEERLEELEKKVK